MDPNEKLPQTAFANAKVHGTELKGARDELQERVLLQTTWCCYGVYAGIGCDGLDLPCCFFIGEVCCLGGTVKCTSCYDQDGCVAAYSKCCCALTGMEYPPDNTPGIGVGPVRCMDNLQNRTPADCSSEAAKAELDTFQKTLWCLACYCCYTGYSYDMNPICSQDGKICCLYVNVESAYCCSDDGCIEADCKCCGIVIDGSIPAGYTPGCVICGATVCCRSMPGDPAPEQEEMM